MTHHAPADIVGGTVDWRAGEALGQLALLAGLVVAAFLLGSVNPASIVAKVLGKDLSHSGSGNPGATNAGRVLGVRWGVLVGALDILKGFLPVVVVQQVVGTVPALVVGLAVVLGHIWSPFLRGQGGKGVATSLGAILAVQPWFALVMLVVFVLLVWRLRWVAGASVSACLVLLLLGAGTWLGWIPGGTRDTGAWCVVLALIVIYRHRRNIELWVSARRGPSTP
ncbi:MAG TPA: glycerol-3-phosphate 1-O-acyltransferase PlsY [Pedococcus sp.]|uniref:glycerol-3-phosphate 1-O-acyltransferase PlsY n=1 Tax=Pedococcus sp. TaxID=2860345 RepID=UPI002F951603